MNSWKLDAVYTDESKSVVNYIYIKTDSDNLESLKRTGFFKIHLRKYVQDVSDNLIICKSNLNYSRYKKVMQICDCYCKSKDIDFFVSDELKRYIEEKEIYIDIRCKMGNEIKARDEKYLQKFQEYKEVVDSCLSRNLRERQMWDSFFMYIMKKSCNFSVPGSGKTASILGMYAYMRCKDSVDKIIVICPKNAFGSWIDEFNLCFDGKEKLNLFNIQLYKPKEKINALTYNSDNANMFLFNYESLSGNGIVDAVMRLIDNRTLLIYDEVHKVKSVDGKYAEKAIEVAKNANHVVAVTGTPIPNTYLDIYNFLHILFPSEYDDFFGFETKYLKKVEKKEDILMINQKISPFFCRTTKQQLNVPEPNKDIIIRLKANEDEDNLFSILKKKYHKNKLALMSRILQLESAPNLLLKMLKLKDFADIIDFDRSVNEIDYVDYSEDVKILIGNLKKSSKKQKCIDLVSGLVNDGKTVVVWCIFRDSIKSITDLLNKNGIKAKPIYGEVCLGDRLKLIGDFKNRKFQVLVTNPHTLAESVSLHTVCHDAVYFEYSYNLVHLLQSKDRIHRLGLKENQYTQYYFLMQEYNNNGMFYSMDEQIYERLQEKEKTMLEAIDSDSLELLHTDDEELELIFSELF
jgi:superfamily II DNA or RNA helicase